MLLLLFRCLFIQLLILHTLSFTFFLCILTCCYTFLLRKMTRFSLSYTHTHTLTFARRESLSTSHDVVVNVFFLHCCCSVSLSLYADSYLFLSYKREKYVDKVFTSSMHVCMCVLPLANTHFSFYILSIFLFFNSFCNRHMK